MRFSRTRRLPAFATPPPPVLDSVKSLRYRISRTFRQVGALNDRRQPCDHLLVCDRPVCPGKQRIQRHFTAVVEDFAIVFHNHFLKKPLLDAMKPSS